MIPDQWYVVLDSNQLKDQPIGVTRLGEKLVFWRDRTGKIACLPDQCVHRGVALSKGKIMPNGHLQCPFHGFEYDSSGAVTVIPANGYNTPVPAAFMLTGYPTHESNGFIWIWWGHNPPENLQPPEYFEDIDSHFYYDTGIDPWQTHYSRVIENQLDVVHLPFVHHNTIGRGNQTLVNGPALEWLSKNHFRVYTDNEVDQGQIPKKPSEMDSKISGRSFWIEFIFPNLWQNHISDQVRIVAAFVPVNENNTLLYLRFYQKFFRVPLLANLVTRLSMPPNLYIAHQDRGIVQTHREPISKLRGDEKLIQGDRPIVEYRRRRDELLQKAS